MSNMALICTLCFVAIASFISMRQKLGLEKEILIGTLRSAVQLLFIGYVLHFVFETSHPAFIVIIILCMILIAAWNAGAKAKHVRGIRSRIAITLACTEGITMAILLGLRIITPTPQYIIPVSGIIIGSSMIVCGLLLNHMKREMETARGEMEMLLALGATEKQAVHSSLRRSVRASMIPTVDGMKTVGLVQLPGMMTGMIVAGADPIEAVRYQILIMFVLASSAAMTAMVFGLISYKLWFTKDARLLPLLPAEDQ
jgi:TIGR00245 family protein